MAKKILVVVDVQNDFVYGSLGSDEAVAVVPNIVKKVNEYKNNGDFIIFTKDTHEVNYLNTQEGRKLPVEHCIRNTYGWEIISELAVEEEFPDFKKIRYKDTFGYHWDWLPWIGMFELDKPTYEVEIIGLCTDICVITNALCLKTEFPEVEITVDSSCCAGSTPERHKAALEVMKSCQINVIGEEDE